MAAEIHQRGCNGHRLVHEKQGGIATADERTRARRMASDTGVPCSSSTRLLTVHVSEDANRATSPMTIRSWRSTCRRRQRRVVSALIGRIFAQEGPEAVHTQWRTVADQLRPRFPKAADLMDRAEHDVLAHMTVPREHRTKLHSTNPLERLSGEIKRRTEVVGIFPNEAAIYRLAGALLLEQTDEWTIQRRYPILETLAGVGDTTVVSVPAVAR